MACPFVCRSVPVAPRRALCPDSGGLLPAIQKPARSAIGSTHVERVIGLSFSEIDGGCPRVSDRSARTDPEVRPGRKPRQARTALRFTLLAVRQLDDRR